MNSLSGVDAAAKAFDQWKSSSGHNRNMLRSTSTVVGLGLKYCNGRTYVTAMYGKGNDQLLSASASFEYETYLAHIWLFRQQIIVTSRTAPLVNYLY
jgi:hypothetical protein